MAPRALGLAVLMLASAPALAQHGGLGPPWTTSATDAYLISAASTVGAVGLGAALYHVFPEGDGDAGGSALRGTAAALVVLGVVVGPSMGNIALGAPGDARRGMGIKGIGIGVGGALALGSLGVVLGCYGSPDCGQAEAEGFLIAGALVAGAGVLAGTAYDLATIPGNAGGRARLALAPTGLSLTVGL